MRYLAAAFLFAISAWAQSAKPACNSKLSGRFWPEFANRDPDAARRLSRLGELEICSQSGFRYKWQLPAVHVSALEKRRRYSRQNAFQPTPAQFGGSAQLRP